MTEILFHFNVPDKLGYACRMLRKMTQTGAQVVVAADPQQLADLDFELWRFSGQDFIAHCFDDSGPDLLAFSPIVLGSAQIEGARHQMLLSLGPDLVPGFERFERLNEIVGVDPQDRQQARLRWNHFKNLGYALQRHDAAPAAATP